jgi:hypothetical protein
MKYFFQLGFRLLFLATFACLLGTSGCISQQKCNRLYPPQVSHTETTTIIQHDSILPGADVEKWFYKDSIAYYPAYKIQKVTDTSGLAELTWYKDAYGNIVATCTANERLIKKFETFINSQSTKSDVIIKKEMAWWGWALIGIMAFMIGYITFKRFF